MRVRELISKMGREGMKWKGEMKGGVKKMEEIRRGKGGMKGEGVKW